jgi:hypothetical protein
MKSIVINHTKPTILKSAINTATSKIKVREPGIHDALYTRSEQGYPGVHDGLASQYCKNEELATYGKLAPQ